MGGLTGTDLMAVIDEFEERLGKRRRASRPTDVRGIAPDHAFDGLVGSMDFSQFIEVKRKLPSRPGLRSGLLRINDALGLQVRAERKQQNRKRDISTVEFQSL